MSGGFFNSSTSASPLGSIVIADGHFDLFSCRNCGPSHHVSLFGSSDPRSPQEGMSAGFNDPGQ